VKDPSVAEFAKLFEAACSTFGCKFFPEAVHYLIQTHYTPRKRQLRRCHARDLLAQIKSYCAYYGRPMELRPDYLDRVVKSYFTAVTSLEETAPCELNRATSSGSPRKTQPGFEPRKSLTVIGAAPPAISPVEGAAP
jgi:hypothetical protein